MNTKITFTSTRNYDEGLDRCGFLPEWDDLTAVLGEGYDFEEYLYDQGICFEQEDDEPDLYFVTEYGERTGEVYWLVSCEPTNEEPHDWG